MAGRQIRDRGFPVADPAAEAAVGQVLTGRYRLSERLGEGPIGSVYDADDLVGGSGVRVEIVPCAHDGDDLPLFDRRRATGTRTVEGPRAVEGPSTFVAVHDCNVTEDGCLFLVTERVEGKRLSEVIRTESPLECGRALRLAVRIGEALEAAQNLGLLGLDIRPQHIMVVGADETVKLLSSEILTLQRLGLAKSLVAGGPAAEDAEYRAPETVAGGSVTERTDIYRFGVLLHALLTGTVPRPAPARGGLMALFGLRRFGSVQAACPGLPPVVEDVLLRSLDPKPEARPRSMSTVLNVLWGALGQLEESAESPEGSPRFPTVERLRRNGRALGRGPAPHLRWRWVLLAVLLLAVGGPVAWKAAGPRREVPVPTAAPSPPGPEGPPRAPAVFVPTRPVSPPDRGIGAAVERPTDATPATAAPKADANAHEGPPATRQRESHPPAARTRDGVSSAEARVPRVPADVAAVIQPVPSREPNSPDPGAIIDWLLKESGSGDN